MLGEVQRGLDCSPILQIALRAQTAYEARIGSHREFSFYILKNDFITEKLLNFGIYEKLISLHPKN